MGHTACDIGGFRFAVWSQLLVELAGTVCVGYPLTQLQMCTVLMWQYIELSGRCTPNSMRQQHQQEWECATLAMVMGTPCGR